MYKTARQQLEDRVVRLDQRISTLSGEFDKASGPLMRESIYYKIEDLEAERSRIVTELEQVHDQGRGAIGATKWAFPGTQPERGGFI